MVSYSESASLIYREPALSTTPKTVKASNGRIYGYHIENPNTLTSYVQVFDALVGDVTLGTTTPDLSWAIPAYSVLNDSSFKVPLTIRTGIVVAATTTPGGDIAPANALLVHVYYL